MYIYIDCEKSIMMYIIKNNGTLIYYYYIYRTHVSKCWVYIILVDIQNYI